MVCAKEIIFGVASYPDWLSSSFDDNEVFKPKVLMDPGRTRVTSCAVQACYRDESRIGMGVVFVHVALDRYRHESTDLYKFLGVTKES